MFRGSTPRSRTKLRVKHNTSVLIDRFLVELEAQGIETEKIQFAGPIRGCIACFNCSRIASKYPYYEGINLEIKESREGLCQLTISREITLLSGMKDELESVKIKLGKIVENRSH